MAQQQQYQLVDATVVASKFRHVLPTSRTGRAVDSLEAFHKKLSSQDPKIQEYSLVMVTELGSTRILLGLKHRGFGQGMMNSFGGKKEASESAAECACRELQEETGIVVPLQLMTKGRVGSMQYTFEDQAGFLMLAHIFHVQVCLENKNDNHGDDIAMIPIEGQAIRGCEEITPQWFDSYWDIPLDNMFADDSLWLTQWLLAHSRGKRLKINGWFHFEPGGQAVNSIQYYFLEARIGSFSLEKRLFHALCCHNRHNTTIKEFKEAWAFGNAVQSMVRKHQLEVVIDVAGGHGALAALLLITTSASRAVVIDPAQVGGGTVEKAWRTDFLRSKSLAYRHEDLRTGLPDELARVGVAPDRVLVVACHACQHLSEDVLRIVCCQFPGVHVAVMPCCQRDTSPGDSWKNASKNLQVPMEKVMDLLLAGKVMSWQIGQSSEYDYDVRMKVIDRKITPQNRILLCKAVKRNDQDNPRAKKMAAAHLKLASTYAKAHAVLPSSNNNNTNSKTDRSLVVDTVRNCISNMSSWQIGGLCGLLGFAAGVWISGGRNDQLRKAK